MPFYQNTVFGPSSATSSPEQRRHTPTRQQLSSPLSDSEAPAAAAAARPFRMPRDLHSPASSPIPLSPTYHSYHNADDHDDEDNDNNEEERRQQGADGLVSSRPRPSSHAPRSAVSPTHDAPYPNWSPNRSSGSDSGDHDRSQERRRRSPSSQPPPPPPEPPVYCAECKYPLPEEMRAYVEETSTYASVPQPHCPACGCRLRPTGRQGVRQHESRLLHRGEGDRKARNGYDANSDDSSSTVDGFFSDSGIHTTRRQDEEQHQQQQQWARERRKGQRRRASSPQASRRSPLRDQDVEVNLYSDAEGEKPDHSKTQHGGVSSRQQQQQQQQGWPSQAPRSVLLPPPSSSAVPRTGRARQPLLLPKSPYLTLDTMPQCFAATLPHHHHHHKKKKDNDGQDPSQHSAADTPALVSASVPWATPGCSACTWQCSAGLAGLCCCVMPCVLFRERQQLLFHALESRYICCAGAFPCCVPPESLRPELYYYAVQPGWYADGGHTRSRRRQQQQQEEEEGGEGGEPGQRHRRRHRTRGGRDVDGTQYWASAVEVSRDGDNGAIYGGGGGDGGRRGRDEPTRQRPAAALLHSSTGVASPASLVNPHTGLPLEGCYRNTPASTVGTKDSHPGDSGTGCCDCVTCTDGVCVWDCTSGCCCGGCCLPCAHPTACCLACPLCCLCCELTLCLPCALWANRLLIRQHYGLAPDPAIDKGAVCCYTCCLQCCTCGAVPAGLAPSNTANTPSATGTRETTAAPVVALSCWSQLATSVAACLAAVCCLCPCAACSLAQQRDQMQRLGYPLVVEVPPEMEMM